MRDRQAKIAIIRRTARLESGLAGDHKSVRGGIQELRVDVGAGYRVYYAFVDRTIILLTCGGNKQSQDRDIASAIEMLRDWKKRNDQSTPPS
ncbi:putative addiction module killer protein [Duganella sp. SG902]|uniref:type II toxin-antitoxin system RelE/ParE family toxin n=1 Tax=Duganella sp. SG902 TaxID=2587016 RepID=UPI00179DFB34|nr:type II toxin-antitoxin system RelE/ParE family toxin [Duganella sp. SG902]NVM75605.1 putative addiction module killer protein [Duganella sp. SG902]